MGPRMADPMRRLTRVLAASEGAIAEAGRWLRAGGLVALPTETVYGLAADATSDRAVASIFEAKGRPVFNPLIAHVLDATAAREAGRLNPTAEALAAAYWPGPLTIVAPIAATCRVSQLARAGLDTIALRVSSHAVARAVIAAAGVPLAAPSANLSGHVSPTRAEHVRADLDQRIDLILDGGPTKAGLESTIVACLDGPPRLLRHGAIAKEEIESFLGLSLVEGRNAASNRPIAPGLLVSHYAPAASLRLEAVEALPGEAALDFAGAMVASRASFRLDLSPAGDLTEAAANLFAHLRALDRRAKVIAVAPIPSEGLGAAINDRLRRAAAPRGEGRATSARDDDLKFA
jgi:L-threonylcarbamoyladenylate synthase